jgi:hypothetical protein
MHWQMEQRRSVSAQCAKSTGSQTLKVIKFILYCVSLRADATSYPLPEGSKLPQALNFLAFTFYGVCGSRHPPENPRGKALTPARRSANKRLTRRAGDERTGDQ